MCFFFLGEVYVSDNSVNVFPWVSGKIIIAIKQVAAHMQLWIQNNFGKPKIPTHVGNIFIRIKMTKNLSGKGFIFWANFSGHYEFARVLRSYVNTGIFWYDFIKKRLHADIFIHNFLLLCTRIVIWIRWHVEYEY